MSQERRDPGQAGLRALYDCINDLKREIVNLEREDARTASGLDKLRDKVEQLQDHVVALESKVDTMLVLGARLNGKADKLASFKTFMQFTAAVIVPILVAIIGVYIALHTQIPANP